MPHQIKNVFLIFLLLNNQLIHSQNFNGGIKASVELEKSYGVEFSDANMVLLDSIFMMASQKIDFVKNPEEQEAIEICKQFSDILKNDFHFKFENVQLLKNVLDKRIIDCNFYSLFFYTLLHKSQLYEVYTIHAPGHMFIRWYLTDSTYFNYETTTAEVVSDSALREEFSITPLAEANHLYMYPLSDTQMTALHLAELAYEIVDTNINLSIDISKKALELDPKSFHVYRNLSLAYLLNKQQDSSDYYFNKARELDSLNYTVYFYQGKIMLYFEEYDKAIDWFNKSLAINPEVTSLYMYRCYTYIKKGFVEEALSDFEQSNKRIDKGTLHSLFIDYPLLYFLDESIMYLIFEKENLKN